MRGLSGSLDRCLTVAPTVARAPGERHGCRQGRRPECPHLACQRPAQQKTPHRGGGAFLGLLQGGEICISIYVDLWEVGEPFVCRGRNRWESTAYMAARDPARKFSLALYRSSLANP